MKKNIFVLSLILLISLSIVFVIVIYVHHNSKYNKTSSPPYIFTNFQYGSDTRSVQDEIMTIVKSSEYEKADNEKRIQILVELLSELSIHGTKEHQYPLIKQDSIYTEGNSVWAIYSSPDDFYSRWEIEDTRIIQYSYADYDSWERRESTDRVYFIYNMGSPKDWTTVNNA